MTFTDDSFTVSYAQLGGAILSNGNTTAKMYNITIENNRAEYGGGIAAVDSQLSLTCQPHFQGEWVWEVTPHFRSACQNLGRANENGVLNHVTDIM